jgi:hypothetical protein
MTSFVNQKEQEDDDSSELEEQEDDVPANSVVPANSSHMPKRIYIQNIGRKRRITPEKVVPVNGVVLEVEGDKAFHLLFHIVPLFLGNIAPQKMFGDRKPLNTCHGVLKVQRPHGHNRGNIFLFL